MKSIQSAQSEGRGSLEFELESARKRLLELEELLNDYRHYEEQARSLAQFPDQNPNPVLRINFNGQLIYANQASAFLLSHMGLSPGQTVSGLLLLACGEALSSNQCHIFTAEAGGRHYYLQMCPVQGESYYNLYGLDITELYKARKDLQTERDFSNAVIQLAGSLVMVLDRKGRIVRFNKACEILSGYTYQEIKGQVFKDFLPSSDGPCHFQGMLEAAAQGDIPNRCEDEWETRHGDQRLIEWSNTVITNASGEVDFFICAGTDITERRRAEQRRVREQRSLEAMSGELPAGVTAASLGLKSIKTGEPAIFEALTGEFARILEQAVHALVFRASTPITKAVEAISEKLGDLRAGPRDVMDIFLAALSSKCTGSSPEKARAYREEGRIMLIELLGRLASYYRNHCPATFPGKFRTTRNRREGHQ